MTDRPVITRFAPSPTGHLHVGGARTALFCWALARAMGGRFLLRIEDTDQARSSAEAVEGILEDLHWLGIDWDEGPPLGSVGGDPRSIGPFFQSERSDLYDAAIQELLAQDLAYPAFDTPEELDAMRGAAQKAKQNFRYLRAADWDREANLERWQSGEPCVIRFKMPREAITVEDAILGSVPFEAEQLDDFVLRKRDGFPTYHLAVVVDDEQMGVTHVLRGQEHLNNTPKHMALQRALGYRVPLFAHLPVIQNADGSKMSKRDKDKAARAFVKETGADPASLPIPADRLTRWLKDKKGQLETNELDELAAALGMELPEVSVEDFRRGGYLPEVVVNFLALLGWSPGEKLEDGRDLERFDPAFLAERFGLDRVGRSNARFDRAKLLAFNQESIGEMDDDAFATRWGGWLGRYAPAAVSTELDVPLFLRATRPRSRTLADPTAHDGPGAFALTHDGDFSYDEKAVAKWLAKGDPSGFVRLAELREAVAGIDPFGPDAIEAAIASWCEEREIGMGKAAQPLRVAVTGSAASPALGETLAIVGRDSVLARIDRCLRELGA
jgi:glutamyl-tRNA synthetase